MYGEDVLRYRNYLQVSHPMENGIIQNWDDMELLWQHTFQDCLGIQPEEHRILLTEPPLNPKKNREKMVERMFERFGFRGLYVGVQAVLTLYAQGIVPIVIMLAYSFSFNLLKACKAELSLILETA